MKTWLVFGWIMLFLVSTGCASEGGFSVRNDIGMVRLNEPSAQDHNATAKFSPDGRYFVVVSSRGLLKSDQIESRLSVYSTADCKKFLAEEAASNQPRPRISIKIVGAIRSQRSTAYSAVITELRWSSGSRALYFIAEEANGDRRLYKFDIESGRLAQLSTPGYSVLRYSFTNTTAVYSAWKSHAETDLAADDAHSLGRDGRVVTGESLQEILFPDVQPHPVNLSLWKVNITSSYPAPKRIPLSCFRDISWLAEAFVLSPNGHWLVQLRPVTIVPRSWRDYEPQTGAELFRITQDDSGFTAPTNLWRLKHFSLIDISTGTNRTLVDAPQSASLGYSNESGAVWSSDEKALLLTNTFLPLTGAASTEHAERQRPCAVVFVRLSAMKLDCLVSTSALEKANVTLLPDSLAFGRNQDEIMFRVRLAKGSTDLRRYTWTGAGWKEDMPLLNSGAPSVGSTIRVFVRQGLNEPPTLWVNDPHSGRSKMLWNPNPQLVTQQLGTASVFRWTDASGYKWSGGLVTPPDYAPGKRYPLVLQIYNFDDNLFLTDGMMPTAFAARALAKAGIVVLQMQRRLPHTFDIAEADAQLDGMESAIDHLSDAGIVDRNKVGLVGFSFSCWYVENALIKAPDRFVAATIADGLDMSYMQYHLLAVSSRSLRREFEATLGVHPVGEDLKTWVALAPGFQLDRVHTPLRIEAIGALSVLGEWEIYSSLMMQHKPVDLIYFPNGQHIHQNPQERLESQQGDVDWFRYWLQGYRDPDPAKRAEYERWSQPRSGK